MLTLLTAALLLAQDTPKKSPGVPPAPTGAPIPMPDIGRADPDTVCFVAGTFASKDQRTAGEDSAAIDMETTYFAGIALSRFNDAALVTAMNDAKQWVTGKALDATHLACHDRYARGMNRLRVANRKGT